MLTTQHWKLDKSVKPSILGARGGVPPISSLGISVTNREDKLSQLANITEK